MEFDNSFDVPLPPAKAWAVLTDIPRIAPCMPGAELTEVVDARNYKGKISVRLGLVTLTFAGHVQFESIDEANHRARVTAQGTDAKGRAAANATATFLIEPGDGGSRVLIHTDLLLSGAVAYRHHQVLLATSDADGMIQATAAQIIGQFADNLRAQLAREPAVPTSSSQTAAPSQPAQAKPISGLSVLARVIWAKIAALFTRRRA
ncbi:MAG TPA: SRPBCC family protein [Xanthobacteraceae bacterium]|nr:SRPBCC family protein [Xanthobacteraceae bacterium]